MESCDNGKCHLEKILDIIYKKYVQTCEWKHISDTNYNTLSLIFQPWAIDNKPYDQDFSFENSSKTCTCNETLSSSPIENELEKKIIDDIDKVVNKAKLVRIGKDKKSISEKSNSVLVNKAEQINKDNRNDFNSSSNNSSIDQKCTSNTSEGDSMKFKESKNKSSKSIVTISNPLGKSIYKKDFSSKNTEKVNTPKIVKNLSMYKKTATKKTISKDKIKLPSDVPSSTSSENTTCTSFYYKVPSESYEYCSSNVSNVHLPSCPLSESSFQKNMKVSSTTTEYTNLEQALDILGIPSDLVKCLNLYYNYLIDLDRKKTADVKSSINKNKYLEKLKQMNATKWNDQEDNELIENIRKKTVEYSAKINLKKVNYKEVIIYQSYANEFELQLRQRQNNIIEKIQIFQSIANVIKDELFDLNLKLDKKTYAHFYQFFKHFQSFFNSYQTHTAVVLDS